MTHPRLNSPAARLRWLRWVRRTWPRTTDQDWPPGSAITGTGTATGENVVGMDMKSLFETGRVISSVDLGA